MKRVVDLIIGSTHLEADPLTLAGFIAGTDSTAGEIGILDVETGLAVTNATVATVIPNIITVARVCSDSDANLFLRQSLPIYAGSITSYTYSAYSAAVAKQVTVLLTGISTTVGTEHVLWITDYNDFNYIVGRRRISYVVQTGDTVDLIGAALATAITNDKSIPNVTAAYVGGTDTLTLTGKAVAGSGNSTNGFRAAHEILFNVIAGDGLIGVAVVNNAAVLPDPGCGTYREVRKMEEVYKGYRGYTNRSIYPTSVNIQYDAVSTDTYGLFVIEHKQPQHTNGEGDVSALVVTTIALKAIEAVEFKADLDAIIAAMR